jgi:hypothetical protein
MKNRPYQIYEGLFYKLLDKCRSVTPDHKFRFKNPLFSMDVTVIDLCLSVFPWAEFRQRFGLFSELSITKLVQRRNWRYVLGRITSPIKKRFLFCFQPYGNPKQVGGS